MVAEGIHRNNAQSPDKDCAAQHTARALADPNPFGAELPFVSLNDLQLTPEMVRES